MLIAVLSDTHGRYPAKLPEMIKGADEIWHLGDVCDPGVLVEFEMIGPPVRVVLGNCDAELSWPLDLTLRRGGMEFFLTHIPPLRVPAEVQVVLHGHTHLPRDEMINGVRWLNPGCISDPRSRGTSFAWLEVEAGRLTRWDLVRLS